MKITPVILSGGSGTRLWPLSRKQYPKKYSPQYKLGRYLMYKYNKESLLDQWFLVRSECKKCSLSSFFLNMQSILVLLCVVTILMSFLGLFEGGFTKVSPLTILLFIFIFIDHNNYKDLDFKLKRATT